MTPAQLARLNKALDYVLAALGAGKLSASEIIAHLQAEHGASVAGYDPYRLRCAGVQGTCTWSNTDGLLASWKKNAVIRSAVERQAA